MYSVGTGVIVDPYKDSDSQIGPILSVHMLYSENGNLDFNKCWLFVRSCFACIVSGFLVG